MSLCADGSNVALSISSFYLNPPYTGKLAVIFFRCLGFIVNFINNKNKNYMVLTLLKMPLMPINIFNHPIKLVEFELMTSLSFTGKEIEASRLSDMPKDIFLNDSSGT